MPINGLLEGLAAGVEKGLGAYQVARKNRLEEEQMRRNQAVQDAQLKAQGYEIADDGTFTPGKGLLGKLQLENTMYDPGSSMSMQGANIGKSTAKLLGVEDYNPEGLSFAEQEKLSKVMEPYAKAKYQQAAITSRNNKPSDNENKIIIKDVAQTSANQLTIKNKIDKTIDVLDDPSANKTTKLDLANQLIKTLNSDVGKDAVGAEEAKRLAYHLQTWRTDPGRGLGYGPDLKKFAEQARSTSQVLQESLKANSDIIDKAKKGGSIRGLIPQTPQKGKLPGAPGVGAIIEANGKKYRVKDASGELEEL